MPSRGGLGSSLGRSKQLAVSIYRNEEAGSEQEIVDVSLLKRASRQSSRRNRNNQPGGTEENIRNHVVEENTDSDTSW